MWPKLKNTFRMAMVCRRRRTIRPGVTIHTHYSSPDGHVGTGSYKCLRNCYSFCFSSGSVFLFSSLAYILINLKTKKFFDAFYLLSDMGDTSGPYECVLVSPHPRWYVVSSVWTLFTCSSHPFVLHWSPCPSTRGCQLIHRGAVLESLLRLISFRRLCRI